MRRRVKHRIGACTWEGDRGCSSKCCSLGARATASGSRAFSSISWRTDSPTASRSRRIWSSPPELLNSILMEESALALHGCRYCRVSLLPVSRPIAGKSPISDSNCSTQRRASLIVRIKKTWLIGDYASRTASKCCHDPDYLGGFTTRAHPTISTSELPGIQSTDMNARDGVFPEPKKPRYTLLNA